MIRSFLLPHCRVLGMIPGLMLVAGCAVGPDYRPLSAAELKVPDRFAAAPPVPGEETDLALWWTAFRDPVLSDLVARGLSANLDIAQAGSRLRQARAQLRQARADLFPTLDATGSINRSVGRSGGGGGQVITTPGGAAGGGTIIGGGSGGDITIFRGGLDASYQADLFGGVRRNIEAARAGLGSSEAALHVTQLTIASDIAANYVSARLAQAQLDVATRTLAVLDDTLQIVGWRVQAGLVSALDAEQARQLRAQTAATVPALRTAYVAAVNRLAVLLGEAPGAVTALIDPVQAVPLAPAAFAQAIPAAVVQRRPDVAQAERTAAAETARVGVQQAQLYPALRLSGTLAGSGSAVGDVVSTAIGNLLAAVSAPIFQGGRLRGQVQAQRAVAQGALDAYRQTVLIALEETDNALTAVGNTAAREREQSTATEAARNAATYARSQYQAGLIDFLTLLDAERTLLTAENNTASARADRATAAIQLYNALGGGWEAAPLPATALADTITRR